MENMPFSTFREIAFATCLQVKTVENLIRPKTATLNGLDLIGATHYLKIHQERKGCIIRVAVAESSSRNTEGLEIESVA